MKKLYYNLALQTGGSHYPGVGGKLLEDFGDNLVQEIVNHLHLHGHDDAVLRIQKYLEENT